MTSPSRRGRGRPKQEGLAEQRREQIVEAAYQVFTEKGYQTTNVSAIAARAGMGQGTVYRYFDSKIEILREVFDYTAEKMFRALDLATLSVPVDSFDALSDRIAHVGAALTDLVAREPQLLKILAVEASAADPELQERVMGIERMLAGLASAAITNGIEQGVVRPEVDGPAYGHLLVTLTLPGFIDAYRGELTPQLRDRHISAVTGLVERALRNRAAAS